MKVGPKEAHYTFHLSQTISKLKRVTASRIGSSLWEKQFKTMMISGQYQKTNYLTTWGGHMV